MADMIKRSVPTALLVAVTAAASSLAQTNGEAVLERCGQIDDAQGRIACLEAAVLALAGGSAPEADAATPTPATMPVDPPAPVAASREPEASVMPVSASSAGTAAPREPADTVTTARSDDRPADVEPVAEEDSIGAEQVEALTRTRDEHLAGLEEARGLRVEKFEKVGFRQLQVHLENGQVWRQIRGDVQDIRVTLERNPTVDIVESSIGGYRLKLNEIKRTIRVRRVR